MILLLKNVYSNLQYFKIIMTPKLNFETKHTSDKLSDNI